MPTFDAAMTGAGPFYLRVVYEVQAVSGGNQVAATAQWFRGPYGSSSNNGAAPFKLDIGGSEKTGTRNFSAPAGGDIAPQWIESHAVVFPPGVSSTYITVTFSPNTASAGNGAINTLTVPIATASKASFSEVAGPAITSFDAGHQVTVHMNRQSSSYTHEVAYLFGGSGTVMIATGVGSSVDWTPPLSLLNQIPNSVSGAGIVGVNTFNGAAGVGYTNTPFTLTAPASVVPTLSSCTYTDQNATVASIVGKPVAGLSRVKLTVNGAGVYSSTITAAEATLLGTTVPSGGEVAVTAGGALPVTAKVTDSRGRQATWAGTLDALPYTQPAPTAPWQLRRSSSIGTPQDDGTYLRLDLAAAVASLMNGTERNAITIRVFTRPNGGTVWTPRNVIVPGGITYNTWVLVSGGGIFSATASYDVRVRIEDKFAASDVETTVATASVTLDLYGKNVGVGKIWERGVLDVAGDIYQAGNVVIDTSDVASEVAAGIVELATQAEVNAGTDPGRALTPATVRNAAWLPYSTSTGRGTSSASGAVTVTFPAGRFTQPPRLSLTPMNHTNVITPRIAADPTATSFQVQMFTMPGGALVAANFDWTAVQMTAGSGSG
ncbi:DUF859 family phage minor structural protein [Microbacterium sp. K24]|uniref:DUF859 family phage minor structural protein n=1 Tax=Microbacterium sp. K24 TaxID=2305446 RepID=UPI00109D3BD2|nr:DUF859 family phage minor structural protein [Microbacterium sp. K24]